MLGTFRGLIEQHGIKIHLDVPLPEDASNGSRVLSVDVEHDEQGTYVLTGFFDSATNSYYGYTNSESLSRVYSSSLKLVAHNWNGDFESLRQWGTNVRDEQLVSDTMLFGHVLDSSLKAYGLKDMAKHELGLVYPSYDDIVGKRGLKAERITLDKQPLELVVHYNAMDVFSTAKLYEKQVKGVSERETKYFTELEKPVSTIFNQMSDRGVRIDLPYLRQLQQELEAKRKPLEEAIKNELGPINLNSPKQLLGALHAKEIYPELKGKPSTDKRALTSCQNEGVVRLLLQFSELDTLLSSFVRPYIERGTAYVHPFYNQVGTRTGRLSCSNPNLLQIPRRTENGKLVRKMFIPRERMSIYEADYSSIEPCVLADLSGDPAMRSLFINRVNFHGYFANKLSIDRDTAKVFDLETYYGATKYGVARHLGCSLDQAQLYINMAWGLFPHLRRWRDKTLWEAKKNGYITTLMGRRIKIEGLDSSNSWKRESAERQTMNNLCQASAREVMVKGMLKVSQDKRLSPTFGLLIQIYDSLVFETPDKEDMNYVVEDMESAIELSVPLTVDLKMGPNWGEMEKVNYAPMD